MTTEEDTGGVIFEEVYAYRPVLAKYLRGKVPWQDAEDLMQDTFLYASQRLHKYDKERGSIVAWLLCILRGRFRNFLRKQSCRNEVSREVEEVEYRTPYEECRLLEALHNIPVELQVIPTSEAERLRHFRMKRRYRQQLQDIRTP